MTAGSALSAAPWCAGGNRSSSTRDGTGNLTGNSDSPTRPTSQAGTSSATGSCPPASAGEAMTDAGTWVLLGLLVGVLVLLTVRGVRRSYQNYRIKEHRHKVAWR